MSSTGDGGSAIDYSAWDHIYVSDDEDVTSPFVDTSSLFRMRHRVSSVDESVGEKTEALLQSYYYPKSVCCFLENIANSRSSECVFPLSMNSLLRFTCSFYMCKPDRVVGVGKGRGLWIPSDQRRQLACDCEFLARK